MLLYKPEPPTVASLPLPILHLPFHSHPTAHLLTGSLFYASDVSGNDVATITAAHHCLHAFTKRKGDVFMTEGLFFDDQPPTEGLSHWATITQVSTFLSVPRTTVRGTVRRAATSGESWVKK